MLKGSVEFNKVQRNIDSKLLQDAFLLDFKPIYNLISDYFSRYKTPPSYKILSDNLATDYDTLQLIFTIQDEICEESEILFYLDQVKARYGNYLATKLASSVGRDDFDLKDFNDDLVGVAAKIERMRRTSTFSEGDFRSSADERYDDYLYTAEHPNEISGVFLGYPALDDYTFGVRNSEMLVISGASSSGKSLLMMNIAVNAWLGSNIPHEYPAPIIPDGKNVLFFSLEMSKKQLEQRIDANVAAIRHKALSRGLLTDEERLRWKKSLEFQKNFNKHFYVVDMPRGSRVLDIEARFNTITSEFQPDVVCVDYLGIMKSNSDYGQDWLEIGHVAADLHEFCRNKNIPVITAAQRKARSKNNKSQFNDLEELGRSKMIGDNSNIVFLIEEREDEHLKDDMVIHVVKNRDGAKGEVKLQKDFACSRIVSLPDNWTIDSGEENSV